MAAGVERSRVTKVGQRDNGGAIGSGHLKMHSGEKSAQGTTMGSGASTTASCLFVFPSLNAAL